MTAVREQPVVRPSTSPAQRLRATMAAVRVAFCWFGVRKTLTPEQKAQAADTFGAEGQYLSAGKKLLDNRRGQIPNVEIRMSKREACYRGDVSSLPGTRHPAHPPGQDRRLQPPHDRAAPRPRRGRGPVGRCGRSPTEPPAATEGLPEAVET